MATHQPDAPADHRRSRTAAAGQITAFTGADQLRDAVFYYAGGELTAADLAWVASRADGLVMRASNAALVRRLRSEHGYDRPILLDPGCYAAKPEGPAARPSLEGAARARLAAGPPSGPSRPAIASALTASRVEPRRAVLIRVRRPPGAGGQRPPVAE